MERLSFGLKAIGLILALFLIKPLLLAAAAFLGIKGIIVLVSAAVLMLANLFGDLGKKLFKDKFASSFLDGLVKIATAFGSVAEMIIGALNPITQMTKFVDALGSTFTGIIDSISSFFAILTAPEASQNIREIAEAITAIPTTKNLEFVASMAAAATTATVGAAASTVTAIGSAVGGAVGDHFGGDKKKESITNVRIVADDRPIELTANLMLDREKLATVMQRINGKEAQRDLSSYDT